MAFAIAGGRYLANKIADARLVELPGRDAHTVSGLTRAQLQPLVDDRGALFHVAHGAAGLGLNAPG